MLLRNCPIISYSEPIFVAEKWKCPKALIDRYGTYLLAQDVASGIKSVIENRLRDVIHIVIESKLSMFELDKRLSPEVDSMTINDYEGPPLTRE